MVEVLNQTFYKITNKLENHHGYQYRDGVNKLASRFSTYDSCVEGGLYFTDIHNILKFLSYGVNLRVVTVSQFASDPEFKMVLDVDINSDKTYRKSHSPHKWRSNILFLGEKKPLSDPGTYVFLGRAGLDLKNSKNLQRIISYGIKHNYLRLVRYFVSEIKDEKKIFRWFFCEAIQTKSLTVVKCILSFCPLYLDSIKDFIREFKPKNKEMWLPLFIIKYGSKEIYQYLIKPNDEVFNENVINMIFKFVSRHGNQSMIKFILEKGLNVKGFEEEAFEEAIISFNLGLLKFYDENKIFQLASKKYLDKIPEDSKRKLIYKLIYGSNPEFLEYLGINLDLMDSNLIHCATRAADYRNFNMVFHLLEKAKTSLWELAQNKVLKSHLNLSPLDMNDVRIVYKLGTLISSKKYEMVNQFVTDLKIDLMGSDEKTKVLNLLLSAALAAFNLNYIKLFIEYGADYSGSIYEIFQIVLENPFHDLEFFLRLEGFASEDRMEQITEEGLKRGHLKEYGLVGEIGIIL